MTISDRTKDVIKSGGEWISSVELEGLVMGHPDVFEAAVIAVPDDRWDERPLVCVVPNEGASLDGRGAPVPTWSARWPAGRCPSAGRSSTRCPRPRSASSTRRCCGPSYADGELEVVTLERPPA